MKEMERRKAGWRYFWAKWWRFSDSADEISGTALWVVLLSIVSVFYCALWRPLAGLFRRKSERFKTLRPLRLDALCHELVEGKDFRQGLKKENGMTEWELRQIANHISGACALGAVDKFGPSDAVRSDAYYPEVFELFAERDFWLHVNGYAADLKNLGAAVGFYVGVVLSIFMFWLVR